VKKVAERDGLKLQIVEFTDYIQPNAALAGGDLDANSYQHKPFLDQQVKDRGYKITSVGYTVNFPIGIYSKKVKSLKDLKEGARFGIPNDPTNGGRALLVLQDQGLIKLKPNAGLKATPLDIVENPKKLKFIELEAAQLPRSLDDLDASAVNTNFAHARRPASRQGRHRAGKRQEPLRQHDRRARAGQGQALGGQAGEGLPVGGGPPVRADAVQGRGGPRLLNEAAAEHRSAVILRSLAPCRTGGTIAGPAILKKTLAEERTALAA
jgi:D-methionine transport system substrate-binding protein